MQNYPFTLHVRLNASSKMGCQHICGIWPFLSLNNSYIDFLCNSNFKDKCKTNVKHDNRSFEDNGNLVAMVMKFEYNCKIITH